MQQHLVHARTCRPPHQSIDIPCAHAAACKCRSSEMLYSYICWPMPPSTVQPPSATAWVVLVTVGRHRWRHKQRICIVAGLMSMRPGHSQLFACSRRQARHVHIGSIMLQGQVAALAAPALILLTLLAASAGNVKHTRLPSCADTRPAPSHAPNPPPGPNSSSLEFAPDDACSTVRLYAPCVFYKL